jgi:hypothetical protein
VRECSDKECNPNLQKEGTRIDQEGQDGDFPFFRHNQAQVVEINVGGKQQSIQNGQQTRFKCFVCKKNSKKQNACMRTQGTLDLSNPNYTNCSDLTSNPNCTNCSDVSSNPNCKSKS